MLSFIMCQQVGGETAKRPYFQEGRLVSQSPKGIIHQIKISRIQHPRIREAQPFHKIVCTVDLLRWRLKQERSLTKNSSDELPHISPDISQTLGGSFGRDSAMLS